MRTLIPQSEVLFIASYPPRECGIATYSNDLINAIHGKFSNLSIRVCALEESSVSYTYPAEVKYTLKPDEPENHLALAHVINKDESIKMVLIQHEFGLFGGEYGEHLLQLLYSLEKPVSIVFHTVLPEPDEKRKRIIKAIASICKDIIVMTRSSSSLLEQDYGILEKKISIIPHGTHPLPFKDKKQVKKIYGLQNRLVLSTFGLLSSNKSIETALEALPVIAAQYPNVIYLVLGKTHPGVVRQEGEAYREFLEERVRNLGMEEHVWFVNKYLDLPELLEYLHLTDVYLFVSCDPNQAVSGTFAYAMGTGCPVISTPIPHALEMLRQDTGRIVDFKNSGQLATATLGLLANEELREEMGRNALYQSKASSWENTAIAYAELFRKHLQRKSEKDSPYHMSLTYKLPAISLNHFYALTSNTGMIQFSNISTPDINSGYTLDDNARALVAVCMHYGSTQADEDLELIKTYLHFIEYCQQANGKFLNYVDKYREFHIQNSCINLEDSNGRAIWALGVLMSYDNILPTYFIQKAKDIIDKTKWWISEIESPRTMAFSIKGLYYYHHLYRDKTSKKLIGKLASRLLNKYNAISDTNWKWFEEYLTYANSSLPEAMLYAFLVTREPAYKMIARISFEFLLSHLFSGDYIKVVSNRGWHHRNGIAAKYGEQPIDVSYTIQTLELFHHVFQDDRYRNKMETAFTWFLGNNHLNQRIYDSITGGCCDGLEEHNVNLNQGAESTVCYLIARLSMERMKKKLTNYQGRQRERELVYSTRWLLPNVNYRKIKHKAILR